MCSDRLPARGCEVQLATIGMDGCLEVTGAFFNGEDFLVTCFLFDPPEVNPCRMFNCQPLAWQPLAELDTAWLAKADEGQA
jgi:hypothetical protein